MEKISKPNLVDLLRLSDREKWFSPRIRFASVRSKPCLIQDLRRLFHDVRMAEFVHFVPRTNLPAHVPRIAYCTRTRTFLLNGLPIDVPKISRVRPVFEVRHGKYTLHFGSLPE